MDSLKINDLNELVTQIVDISSAFCKMAETLGNELFRFKYLVILSIAVISGKYSFPGAITIRVSRKSKKPNELATRNLNISSIFSRMGETLRNELRGVKYLVILGIAVIFRKDSFAGRITIRADRGT